LNYFNPGVNWKSCKQFISIEKSGINCLQLFQFLHALFGQKVHFASTAHKSTKKCCFHFLSEKNSTFCTFDQILTPRWAVLARASKKPCGAQINF